MIDLLKRFVEYFAPALAVILWNYEETRVGEAVNAKNKAEMDLQVEKNHEQVDSKYADSSDADVIDDAIVNGGGHRGQLETNSTPSGDTTNGLGQTKPDTDS